MNLQTEVSGNVKKKKAKLNSIPSDTTHCISMDKNH